MQKKSLMILGFVIIITLLAWLVLAVSPSDTLRIVSPTSGTNVLWLNGTLIFNATFMNGTLGLGSGLSETPLFNVTYLFNISGVLTPIANLTNGCVQIGTTGTFACALNMTNLTVAEGNYTLTVNITNGTDGGSGVNSIMANFSGNISSSIVIDHTAPIVETANVSTPFYAGANISSAVRGNFTFNVSIGDAVLGVQAVVINITNSTSDMVRNLTLVQEGTVNRYIASINTTLFTDGYHNFTIHANDSLGNLNNSVRIQLIIVDNTRPIVGISNITTPFYAGANISGAVRGNFTFNVSVGDALAGVSAVIANLTNSTSDMVRNLTLVREGTTNQFVGSFNITAFADGYYNFTVLSNDTAGNENNTAVVQRMIIDNTRPIVGTANVTTPFVSGVNLSGAANGNFTFNVSVGDALAGVQSVIINVTNSTSDMVRNLTTVLEGTNRYVTSINITGFADGYYNVSVLSNDTAGNQNNTVLFQRIIVDNTRPIVATGNVSAPFVAGGNLSGNYTFNVSVGDALAGVQSVIINMTNSTNDMVLNLTLVLEGTNRYITSINTSRFADGYYNITVRTNDTAGNRNDTTIIQRIIIDNTVPSTSLSCTPNPVIQSETITCSCSATDATAGLNTSFGTNGVSTTANPSTTQTGPSFSVSCTSQDRSGNQQTVSTTYSVTSGGSGSSSSSSGGSSSSSSSNSSSSSSSSSGGSGGSPELSPGSTTGSENAGTGSGASGASQGENVPEPSSSSNGWIWALVVLVIIVVIVIVVMKKRK